MEKSNNVTSLESPTTSEVGDVTSSCTHSGVIPGIDSCYCPSCKKSWSQWHPEYKSLFAASGKRHSGETQSDSVVACNVELEMPTTPTTLKVGDKVCLTNQRVVGSIVSLESNRAKVCFGEDSEPRSFLLSELVLAETIISQPTDELEDWTDYEEEDPVEQAIALRQTPAKLWKPNSGFDYNSLENETRVIVEQRTHEIKILVRNSAQHIIDIGQKLADVRKLLSHNKQGGFEKWLKAEFGWSWRTAYNYIKVWESFGNLANFARLDIAPSALYLLAAPSTPEAARTRALALAEEGVQITHKLAAYLIAEYKPKKQPKKSPTGKEASLEDAKTFLTSGDWVELLNPSPESGWSNGDIAEVQDLDRIGETLLLKVDSHLLGKKQRTFSFDDIRKVDMSRPQRAVLPQRSPTASPASLLDRDGYISYSDRQLKNIIKAAKLELTRRHRSNYQKSHNGSVLAATSVEEQK